MIELVDVAVDSNGFMCVGGQNFSVISVFEGTC